MWESDQSPDFSHSGSKSSKSEPGSNRKCWYATSLWLGLCTVGTYHDPPSPSLVFRNPSLCLNYTVTLASEVLFGKNGSASFLRYEATTLRKRDEKRDTTYQCHYHSFPLVYYYDHGDVLSVSRPNNTRRARRRSAPSRTLDLCCVWHPPSPTAGFKAIRASRNKGLVHSGMNCCSLQQNKIRLVQSSIAIPWNQSMKVVTVPATGSLYFLFQRSVLYHT